MQGLSKIKDMNLLKRLEYVLEQVAKKGGGSYDPETWSDIPKQDKWCVGLPGYEWTKKGRNLTPLDLARYVRKNSKAFRPGTCVGIWLDRDKWVLDVVMLIDGKDFAEALARVLGQKAIYNLLTEETVYIKEG